MNVIDNSSCTRSDNVQLLQHGPWRLYRDFVRNHGVSLARLEDLLNLLIFWMPQNSSDDNQWREILYGLLSLHRMTSDLAHQHEHDDDHDDQRPMFGTTVEVEVTTPILSRMLSPTSLRMAITVIHNLLPTILQLSRRRDQRPRVRFWLEQAKFVLRLVLVGSYWFQLYDNQQLESCGLVMEGGMMMTTAGPDGAVGITVAQEQAWRHRQDYVGRRTGRTVAKSVPTLTPSKSIWPLMLGEILHLYRPLHWAGVEQARVPTLLDWAGILGMDVLSLLLLERFKHSALNSQELRRRKFKLFLYLLRSPVFDKLTGPAASRAFRITGKVPFVGSLLESYLWEWLLYWKHPFASELD
ncbi:Peroxisomal membrane protein (Pex16) [Fragilaria crotonensis]|nr:Peroxisomal membrane protein (Pex16) [Fragilaria crotonensis]